MANAFIAMCYAVAKKAGVDTSKMTPDEVVEWYNKVYLKKQAESKSKEAKFAEAKEKGKKILQYKDNKDLTRTSNYSKITLSKQEYAQLSSEIMRKNSTYKNNPPKYDSAFLSNYYYTYENTKEGFIVKSKYDIEKEYEKISRIEEKFKHE